MTRRQPHLDITGPVGQLCVYATDPIRRPHCQLSAVVRYGHINLCVDCDRRRSTLGKGQTPRRLPTGSPINPLQWVATAERDLRVAADTLNAAVARARQHGHTWTAIADTLGVTRQAAQQHFRATDQHHGGNQQPHHTQ